MKKWAMQVYGGRTSQAEIGCTAWLNSGHKVDVARMESKEREMRQGQRGPGASS